MVVVRRALDNDGSTDDDDARLDGLHITYRTTLRHADYEEPTAEPPAMAMIPHPTHASRSVGVESWLMDSGTPLDIVDRSDVEPHGDLITSVKPLRLATANGESRADKGINLYICTLQEDIKPYVLDCTPNALSIGRRVVDRMYDWVWPGGDVVSIYGPSRCACSFRAAGRSSAALRAYCP